MEPNGGGQASRDDAPLAPAHPAAPAPAARALANRYSPWILPSPAQRLEHSAAAEPFVAAAAGGTAGANANAAGAAGASGGGAGGGGAAAAAADASVNGTGLGADAPSSPPAARMLLFCVPQAGMGAWVYHAWAEHLAPRGVEVLPIELPGHNSRMREPPATNLLKLAADIAHVVRQVVHDSMGAWIAYEVVQDLMRSGSLLPVHLFVSGCRAPHLYSASDDLDPTRLHKLATAEEFWAAFGARYGTANPHLANPKIRQLVWPVLRADFALIETYELPAGNRPVPLPTTVFGGEQDRRYTREQIHAWSRHLAGPSSSDNGSGSGSGRFVWIPGAGHDYVEKGHPLLLSVLADTLDPQQPQP
ncbi:hypothetical protein PLESTF_000647000 [Pleodorina starrii]|nr:hypothetical protein PLESTF_000647000 [Pleodorina starrii]